MTFRAVECYGRDGGRPATEGGGVAQMWGLVWSGVALLAAGAIVAAPLEQAAVRITKDPEGYWFYEGDTKVLFYQAERKALPDGQAARSNYFHPLYDLDGNVLTEDFPKDHIHHRGIFWAWHQVRINGKPVQDQWMNSESFWPVRDARTDADARSASLELRVGWESPLFTDAKGHAAAVRRRAKRHARPPRRGRAAQD